MEFKDRAARKSSDQLTIIVTEEFTTADQSAATIQVRKQSSDGVPGNAIKTAEIIEAARGALPEKEKKAVRAMARKLGDALYARGYKGVFCMDFLIDTDTSKVYLGEQAERAAQHFFQRGNLLALRELALRQIAERVDADGQAVAGGADAALAGLLAAVGPAQAIYLDPDRNFSFRGTAYTQATIAAEDSMASPAS